MATTSSALKDLSDQNAVGTRLGTTSTDLICFYGVAAGIVQPTVSGSISSGALASSLAFQLNALGLVKATISA